MALKRATTAGLTAFITANLWTGAPLLALWVGSQVVGKRALSMAAVAVVTLLVWYVFFAGAPSANMCPTGTLC
jgi:hypothetical protein